MPVKIRCRECSKKLHVPDKARGKAVKCPHCRSKLRIPAGGSGNRQKKPAAAGAGSDQADEGDLLANLDLSQIEDRSIRMCPKCGTQVNDAEAVDCPRCGVNLETGVMSEVTRKKRARKGADPALYYRNAVKNAWSFIAGHKPLVWRTFLYTMISSTLALGCLFMVLWCSRTPPKVFWAFCGTVSLLVGPGWVWFLWTEITSRTMSKKTRVKRINFDFFLCSALGIKFFFWLAVFSAPIQLVTGSLGALLIWQGAPVAGAISIGVGGLLIVPLVPIAMAHMTMPVTFPGWLSPKLFGAFGRNAGPALYWTALFLASMLPVFGTLGALGGVYGDDLQSVAENLDLNSRIAAARAFDIQEARRQDEEVPPEVQRLQNVEPVAVGYSVLIGPGILWVVACGLFAFASVFNMRTNGLFGQYFSPRLDLIVHAPEQKWQPRRRASVKEELEPGKSSVSVVLGLAALTAIGCVSAAIYTEAYTTFGLLVIPATLFWAIVGAVWRVYEKAGEAGWTAIVPIYNWCVFARIAGRPAWWGLLLLIPVVGWVVSLLLCIGVAERFRFGTGFGIGLWLLFPLFVLFLGFGPARPEPQGKAA